MSLPTDSVRPSSSDSPAAPNEPGAAPRENTARRLHILDVLLALGAGAVCLVLAMYGLRLFLGAGRMASMLQSGGDSTALILLFIVFFGVVVVAVWIGVARHGKAAPTLLGLRPFARRWWWLAPACVLLLSVILDEGLLRAVRLAFGIDLTPQTSQVISGLARTLPLALAATVAIGALGPLAEELLFRGLIFGCVEGYFGTPIAWAVSSILFAVAHAEPAHIVLVLPIGILLGWVRLRSGSLWPCVIAHAANNTLVVWWAYLVA